MDDRETAFIYEEESMPKKLTPKDKRQLKSILVLKDWKKKRKTKKSIKKV